ncbi:uncharacterized protein JCM6883_001724 [Sporobolomyces salmoneus]|uniref:uncharacterized protein n=1 Tax=Sporobolomyces salmoneus TaxID=183962 RepID=UPI00316CCF5A
MSTWADIAAKNAPPEELQAHPDTSLLEKKEDHPAHTGEHAGDYDAEHVHVVDQSEADKLREAMQHADDSHIEDDFARARRHKEERDAAAQQARFKAQTQQELKKEVDVVEAEATEKMQKGAQVTEKRVEEGVEKVEKKAEEGKKVAEKKIAEGTKVAEKKIEEGKKVAGEKYAEGKKVAGEKWEQGKQEAKEFADKAEREVKKDAKKVQKKAGEIEREGRDLARRYPYAATGIVGLVNATLIAVPAYYAYKNWHYPRWDRRIVSAVAVGLTAAFGAESALGWFEYKEGHRPNL